MLAPFPACKDRTCRSCRITLFGLSLGSCGADHLVITQMSFHLYSPFDLPSFTVCTRLTIIFSPNSWGASESC